MAPGLYFFLCIICLVDIQPWHKTAWASFTQDFASTDMCYIRTKLMVHPSPTFITSLITCNINMRDKTVLYSLTIIEVATQSLKLWLNSSTLDLPLQMMPDQCKRFRSELLLPQHPLQSRRSFGETITYPWKLGWTYSEH